MKYIFAETSLVGVPEILERAVVDDANGDNHPIGSFISQIRSIQHLVTYVLNLQYNIAG